MSDTIDEITWQISWESRKLSAAVSARDRDQVSDQTKKINDLLGMLNDALSLASDRHGKIIPFERAKKPSINLSKPAGLK